MPATMNLVILRHSESIWNLENIFTGWTDVPLSAKGETEARGAGRVMKEEGFAFDIVHTSVLVRA
ncbi:MAG: histidine phosphatase family protein, partial [Actinomycetota bacterium]|nr:histidine phosphatase family protein [Actinomycetota bacterium]